jgi:hypothetical protein
MSLIALLIALIVIGAVLYIVTLLPIDATIKRVIQVIAIVAVVIWLLERVGPALRL